MKPFFPRFALAAACLLVPAALAVSDTDAANLLFMKQEEKLARDVYQVLADQWGHPAFANLALAEQQHLNAVDGLIRRYRLLDTTPAQSGQFSIPELQALYDQLIAAGSQTLADALAAGIHIEQADITDLDEAIVTTKDRIILQVLRNLQHGSRNHLTALTRALTAEETSGATDGCATGNGGVPGGPNATIPQPRRTASRQRGNR